MPSSAIATISAAINGPESHANEKVSCCHRVLYCPLRAKLYALGEEQHRDRTVGEKHLTFRIPETLAKVVTPIGRKGGQIACPA